MENHIVLLDGSISSAMSIFNTIKTVNLKDGVNHLTIIEPRSDMLPLYSKSYDGIINLIEVINSRTEYSSGISYNVIDLEVGENKNMYNKYRFKNVIDKYQVPKWYGLGQIPLKINAILFGINATHAERNIIHWSNTAYDNNSVPYGNDIAPMDLVNIEEILTLYQSFINRNGSSEIKVVFDNRDKSISDCFRQLIQDMLYLDVSLQDILSVITSFNFCSKVRENCYFDDADICATCKHVKHSLENLKKDYEKENKQTEADLVQRVLYDNMKIYNNPKLFPYPKPTSDNVLLDMINYLKNMRRKDEKNGK